MLDCPKCDGRLRRGVCPECGWKPERVADESPKCYVCRKRPPHRSGKCEECGRCAGITDRGRCTFRAESGQGGRTQFCSWHDVIVGSQDNHFEEFERWCMRLVRARVCDRWTHFTPHILWEAMRGARGQEHPYWCGGGDCPFMGQPLLPGALTKPPARMEPITPPSSRPAAEHIAEVLKKLRGA